MIKSTTDKKYQLFDRDNPPDEPTLVVFHVDGEIALWRPAHEDFIVLYSGEQQIGYGIGYQIDLASKVIDKEDISIYYGSLTLKEE